MRPFITALAALVLSLPAFAAERVCPGHEQLIEAVGVELGDGRRLERQYVLIRDGRIARISPTPLQPASAALRIQGTGATLIPGLIDTHRHLYEEPFRLRRERSAERLDQHLRAALAGGVTTVRTHLTDPETWNEIKDRALDPCQPWPRLVPGGPGWFGGRSREDRGFAWSWRGGEDSARQLRLARDSGFAWLALHGLSHWDATTLASIVRGAQEQGLKLMAEGSKAAEFQQAVEAGADSIEYLDGRPEGYPPEAIEALRRAARPVYLSAPVGQLRREALIRRGGLSALPERAWTGYPPAQREALRAEMAEALATAPPPATPLPEPRALLRNWRQLHEAGARLTLATDAGSFSAFHHDAAWVELAAAADAGLSRPALLAMATRQGAELLGLADHGRIAEGAVADLLLIDGRFDQGPLGPERIRVVIKGGRLMPNGADLDRLSASVRAGASR